MLRRVIRMTLWLTATAGVGFVVAKLVQARRARGAPPDVAMGPWPPVDEPAPAPSSEPSEPATPSATAGTAAAVSGEPWVDPAGDACPAGYPVKAKMSSGIFHVPGGTSYDRTRPDRCYRSVEAAEADGLRAARR